MPQNQLFARKSLKVLLDEMAGDHRLKRALGPVTLTALGVGAVIGVGMLDLSWTTYFRETAAAITLTDLFGGIFKSSVYGVLIALSGCLRGLQCGNSSSAVGDAATSAVVTGIVAIVVACGIFAVVFYILGI